MGVLPTYSDIVDLVKRGATVEAQEKIMQLREGALELQEENISLKARIRELEERLEIKEHLEYERSAYWLYRQDDAGDYTIRDGAYCQRCYDVDQKLVRLQSRGDLWMCKQCQQNYRK